MIIFERETPMEQLTLNQIMEAIDSPTSTPGGGSVAALVAQMGTCLARMYGHLTIRSKKFKENNNQDEVLQPFNQLVEIRNQLNIGMHKDMQVYAQFTTAYKSQDEKLIQEAIILAIEVPLEVMKSCVEGLHLCLQLCPLGNKRAISDCACAAILLESCIACSYLNVMINFKQCHSNEAIERFRKEADVYKKQGFELKEKIVNTTMQWIV